MIVRIGGRSGASAVALIAAFLIVFLTSGFLVANNIVSSAAVMLLWVIAFLCSGIELKTINKNKLVIALTLIAFFWLSSYINRENLRNASVLTFAFLAVTVYSNTYDFDFFKERYIKLMSFLAAVSLVGTVLFLLFPFLDKVFIISNANGAKYNNFFIYIHSIKAATRNHGMFWEPGAYQTFLNLALLFEVTKKNINTKRLALFFVTIVTTLSSTGYIAASLIILLMLVNAGKVNKKSRYIALAFCVIAILFVYFNQDALFDTSGSSPFGKVVNFFERKEYEETSVRVTSSSVRWHALTKPLGEFIKSPLFGCGYQGLIEKTKEFTLGMNTCTFVNWFAVYGIGYGLIMLIGMIKIAKKLSSNILAQVMIIIILFVITMSENYVRNAFFMMLALYGYDTERVSENECLTNQQL